MSYVHGISDAVTDRAWREHEAQNERVDAEEDIRAQIKAELRAEVIAALKAGGTLVSTYDHRARVEAEEPATVDLSDASCGPEYARIMRELMTLDHPLIARLRECIADEHVASVGDDIASLRLRGEV